MAGTFPQNPGFQALDFSGRDYQTVDESMTGRLFVQGLGGHRWEFTVRHETLEAVDYAPVSAFLDSQDGARGVFQIVLPVISSALGDAAGGWRMGAAAIVGANMVTTSGGSGSIQAGSYIKFGNHDKVYKVLRDVAAGGTMMIKPNLVAAVPTASMIVYRMVPFTVRRLGDTQDFGINSEGRHSYEARMVEDA